MSQSSLTGGSGDITSVTAGTNLDGGGVSGAVTINLTDETVQDIVGEMVDGGTETRCEVTYDDSTGKLSFVVDDMSTDANTTYTTSAVDSGADAIIRLTGSDASTEDVKLVAGANVTITPSGDNITIVATDTDTNTNQLTTFTVSATTDTTATTISQGDDLMFAAGTGITCETTADGTVTIANTVTDTNTMGSGFTVSATTDTNATTITQGDDLMFTAGTGITCETTADGTVTIANTVADTNTNQLTTFTVSATTDTTPTTISQGDDLMFTAGTGITCETTADGTVTITNTVTNTDTKWDGGATGLTAGTGRTSLGLVIGTDVMAHAANNAVTSATQAWTLPQRTALLTDADGSFDLNAKQNFSCTPGTAVALTFTNHADGQSGFIKLINAGAYVHTAHGNTKIHADDLTAIGAAGTFLLSYLSDGTDTWVTVSKALA